MLSSQVSWGGWVQGSRVFPKRSRFYVGVGQYGGQGRACRN